METKSTMVKKGKRRFFTICTHLANMFCTVGVDIRAVVGPAVPCYNAHIKNEVVTDVRYMSDSLLLEVYERAVSLQLEPAFIELLTDEIKRRNLQQMTGSSRDADSKSA